MGFVERWNQTMLRMLVQYCYKKNQDCRLSLLGQLRVLAYNTSRHECAGFTPFQLMLTRPGAVFGWFRVTNATADSPQQCPCLPPGYHNHSDASLLTVLHRVLHFTCTWWVHGFQPRPQTSYQSVSKTKTTQCRHGNLLWSHPHTYQTGWSLIVDRNNSMEKKFINRHLRRLTGTLLLQRLSRKAWSSIFIVNVWCQVETSSEKHWVVHGKTMMVLCLTNGADFNSLTNWCWVPVRPMFQKFRSDQWCWVPVWPMKLSASLTNAVYWCRFQQSQDMDTVFRLQVITQIGGSSAALPLREIISRLQATYCRNYCVLLSTYILLTVQSVSSTVSMVTCLHWDSEIVLRDRLIKTFVGVVGINGCTKDWSEALWVVL